MGERSAEQETSELAGTGVDVVVQRTPDTPQDEGPAGDGAEPEPPTPVRIRAHSTTTRVTHLVWLTPGRPGPIRRTG